MFVQLFFLLQGSAVHAVPSHASQSPEDVSFTANTLGAEPCRDQLRISSAQGQCRRFPSCGKLCCEAAPWPGALQHWEHFLAAVDAFSSLSRAIRDQITAAWPECREHYAPLTHHSAKPCLHTRPPGWDPKYASAEAVCERIRTQAGKTIGEELLLAVLFERCICTGIGMHAQMFLYAQTCLTGSQAHEDAALTQAASCAVTDPFVHAVLWFLWKSLVFSPARRQKALSAVSSMFCSVLFTSWGPCLPHNPVCQKAVRSSQDIKRNKVFGSPRCYVKQTN